MGSNKMGSTYDSLLQPGSQPHLELPFAQVPWKKTVVIDVLQDEQDVVSPCIKRPCFLNKSAHVLSPAQRQPPGTSGTLPNHPQTTPMPGPQNDREPLNRSAKRKRLPKEHIRHSMWPRTKTHSLVTLESSMFARFAP